MSESDYEINMHEASDEFRRCWATAGNHLLSQVEKNQLNIYRTDLTPPIREHHVFRLGNQLFTIYLEDIDEQLITPASLEGVIFGSTSMNATPCIMKMQRDISGHWQVMGPRWGLIHAQTRKEIFPPEMVTEEKIEISDWELKDFAIQRITEQLRAKGCQLVSHCSPPNNIAAIAESLSHESMNGFFYSVGVANHLDAFAPDEIEPMKLWRGDGYLANVSEPIHLSSILNRH